MTSLDGLHRTTMFTETKNDDENEMLRATRKALQEANDRIETQRLKIHELEAQIAKLNLEYKVLYRIAAPPYGG